MIESVGKIKLSTGAGDRIIATFEQRDLEISLVETRANKAYTKQSLVDGDGAGDSLTGFKAYAADVSSDGSEGIIIRRNQYIDTAIKDMGNQAWTPTVFDVFTFSLQTGEITGQYWDDGIRRDIALSLDRVDEAAAGDGDLDYLYNTLYWDEKEGKAAKLIQDFDYIINPQNEELHGDYTSNETSNSYIPINEYARSLVVKSLAGPYKFSQNSFDAKFYSLGEGRYGVQKKGESTIDEITGVSSLQFQDQALSLANDVAATFNQVKGIDDVSGVVFRLYNAAFARLPDAKGLENWINGNSSGGMTYATSAQEFSSSQEFKNRYGATTTDTQYITTLYNNVLERSPDAAGLANYQNLLANGKTRGALLLDFSESPENRGLFTEVTGLS